MSCFTTEAALAFNVESKFDHAERLAGSDHAIVHRDPIREMLAIGTKQIDGEDHVSAS